MQVILLEKVGRLGNVGDVVKVKDGYGRNFLIPQKRAVRATSDNVAQFEAKRAEIVKENDNKRAEAEKASKKLDKQIVTLIMQSGEDGRLFGSVNSRMIAKALEGAKFDVDHKLVRIDVPIKYTGVHPVSVCLHPEVIVPVYVNVARTEAEAADAKQEFLSPSKKKEKKEEAVAEEEVEAAEPDAGSENPAE